MQGGKRRERAACRPGGCCPSAPDLLSWYLARPRVWHAAVQACRRAAAACTTSAAQKAVFGGGGGGTAAPAAPAAPSTDLSSLHRIDELAVAPLGALGQRLAAAAGQRGGRQRGVRGELARLLLLDGGGGGRRREVLSGGGGRGAAGQGQQSGQAAERLLDARGGLLGLRVARRGGVGAAFSPAISPAAPAQLSRTLPVRNVAPQMGRRRARVAALATSLPVP